MKDSQDCATEVFLPESTIRHRQVFQPKLRSAMLLQMRLAEAADHGLNNALARAVLPFCLRVWPGAMRVTAMLTRVSQPAAVAPQAFAN